MAERGERLAAPWPEDGVASLLPRQARLGGQAWRLDPAADAAAGREFATLGRRACAARRLLDAVLADLYGAQQLLAEGLIPPALVCGSPAFVRAARGSHVAPRRPLLNLYAADLVRGADGVWRVLQDRTALASGLGQVLENRRLLSAAMPEAFQAQAPRSLAPFFELWQQGLARLAPRDRPDPAIAMLTPGTSDAHWFEHVVLSRELGCTLVECGDLTVRGGALFLKTLSGLQPIDVVLSRPRRAAASTRSTSRTRNAGSGVPGLLDAHAPWRADLANAPGAGLARFRPWPAFLPALAPILSARRCCCAAHPSQLRRRLRPWRNTLGTTPHGASGRRGVARRRNAAPPSARSPCWR
jgi:uncharacterized circularly permuted ATP-grasp superfamily protein